MELNETYGMVHINVMTQNESYEIVDRVRKGQPP